MQTTNIKLTNEDVSLKAYLLDASNEMPNTHVRPAILILPGGAYRDCSEREAEPIAMAFLAEGYHAFTLKYSVNQHAAFPKPLNDAEEALDLIREHSSEWGIDPEKVAVCGFSAGGHLAAALGTMGRNRPNAMILGYPCILESMSRIFPAPVPGVDEAVDVLTPPAFIFHTFDDALVPVHNSLAFAGALDRAGVSFELHIFKDGVHGLSLARPVTSGGLQAMNNPAVAEWFSLCTTWIRSVFGDFSSNQTSNLNEDIKEYSLDVQLGVLWKNESCKKLIQTIMPALGDTPPQDAMAVPLQIILEYAGDLLPKEEALRLDQELRKIPLLQE